ncbi:PREDICTED: rhodanese-like domain-containing protein 4A, chloroplastic [Camelina sativa]|uniref:Rhodanese-like domain-containing protein 4A, chloroplastic n=1 Tax=Camelina sativa TaxID=90675 RepID=A0ABM0XNT0_CAMSA|nr:PREDICTED: rhodanese-like domain-containing protein 4A, chloroplastic [Camelina sativa]
MTSLPMILASSPPRNLTKPSSSTSQFPNPVQSSPKQLGNLSNKTHLSLTISQLILTSPVLASESFDSISDPPTGKIDLESVLVTIDNFFNKYPFFVAGCTFMYLVVYPAVIFYLRKYKPISAVNAFRKLKNEPDSQLLDIRDDKTLALLASPNLRFLGKSSVQVPFSESDEEGFLRRVKGSFSDPENTVVCVLDNFDGNSSKVAELLIEDGFKEAYYIRGGARGKNGWLAIQEELLPPPVHMFTAKNVKSSNNNEASIVGTEN